MKSNNKKILIEFDSIVNFFKKIKSSNIKLDKKEKLKALKKAVLNDDIKSKTVHKPKDTYNCMPWTDFIELCNQNGFKLEYRKQFVDKDYSEDNTFTYINGEEVILVEKENALVIYATFYNSQLSDGELYGQVIPIEGIDSKTISNILEDFLDIKTEYGVIRISLSLNRGIISHLLKLYGNFKFVNPWVDSDNVWFLNYVEESSANQYALYDYVKKVSDDKISQMSDDVQKIMGYKK